MNILIYNFKNTYIMGDCVECFISMGHKVDVQRLELEQSCYENDICEYRIKKQLKKNKYDAVFTVNYYPVTAKVCNQLQILYLSWQYDSPPNLPSTDTLDYPTNRIFFFSKFDCSYYRALGIDNAFYLPLASNWRKIQNAAKFDEGFRSDVSLVGSLYKSPLPELKALMSDEQSKYLDAVISVQLKYHGCKVVDESLTPEFVSSICEHYKSLSETAVQPTRAELFYAVCSHITRLERISLLRLSAALCDTALYAVSVDDDEKEMLKGVNIRKAVDYTSEMPRVFNSSKINLNPVLRANRSAIPLRALDIMASKGFMLTSSQSEFENFFEKDTEYVCYENIYDAMEKIKFYLENDEQRQRVVWRAYERIKKDFNYEDRINIMLELI